MYCKTTTYINLKRIADRAHRRWAETDCEHDWNAFEELEMECANYALENEEEIEWNRV